MAEARRLVVAAAGAEPLDLVVSASRPLDEGTAARITTYVERRAAHEPLSRILGRREFYGREFALSSETLDPRPETEGIVDMVKDICTRPDWQDRPIEILDVGTGSGAILISLIAELPRMFGLGIDISADALQTARRNAESHGVANRAEFAFYDVLKGGGEEVRGPARGYDFVVSNPPYIASADIRQLEPEVRLFDPLAALDGGPDGLQFYRVLAGMLGRLADGGWMVVEVGAGQAEAVATLLATAAPGAVLRTGVDLAGHTRIVAIQPRTHSPSE